MKIKSFNSINSILALGFQATFKLACEANHFRECTAMRAMPYFLADRVASYLNSRRVQRDGPKGMKTTVHSIKTTLQAFSHRFYQELVSHLLKRYTYNEAIAEANAAIFRPTQSAIMTPLKNSKALLTIASHLKNVYDEDTLDDTFIERVDELIRHSLRGYWATHSQADLTDLAFQTKPPLTV